MAERHIPRARLEAARCTPMAESHNPRGRLKAAKKGLHRLCILRLTACVASAASSSQGSLLAGVPPRTACLRELMAQGRGHRRGPRALTRSVVAACGRGLKAIVIIGPATFALWLWRPELQPMELPLGQFGEGDPLFNEVPRQSCHAGATPRQHEGVIRIGLVRVVDVIIRGPVHLVDD